MVFGITCEVFFPSACPFPNGFQWSLPKWWCVTNRQGQSGQLARCLWMMYTVQYTTIRSKGLKGPTDNALMPDNPEAGVCVCVCCSTYRGCSQWAGSRWTEGPWRWWGQDSSCPSGCPDRSHPDCWCCSGKSSCGTSPGHNQRICLIMVSTTLIILVLSCMMLIFCTDYW